MRGESKYHYVDLSLIEDAQGTSEAHRAKLVMDGGSRTSERPLIQRYAICSASFRSLIVCGSLNLETDPREFN